MSDLGGYLGECRERVLPQIQRMIPEGSPYRGVLYDRMMEYALRDAKMLRRLAARGARAGGHRCAGVAEALADAARRHPSNEPAIDALALMLEGLHPLLQLI